MCVGTQDNEVDEPLPSPKELTHLLQATEHSSAPVLVMCGTELMAISGDRTKICLVGELCSTLQSLVNS